MNRASFEISNDIRNDIRSDMKKTIFVSQLRVNFSVLNWKTIVLYLFFNIITNKCLSSLKMNESDIYTIVKSINSNKSQDWYNYDYFESIKII